ncbi:MAG: hypothetical protein HYV20_14980 [Gemmatimonadetes bacterium]|nr:hypothetical protein [Gemmatimonadota bacterium]
MTPRSGLAPAVIHRSGVVPAVIHRSGSVPAVIHRSAADSLLGQRSTEDVRVGVRAGVEERQTHEHDKDHGTRKGEWQMVAEKATTQVAAGAKRLIRTHHPPYR